MMRCSLLCLAVIAASLPCLPAEPPPPKPPGPKLLLAFASVRERRAPPYPKIYFYEHDGVAKGRLLGAIETIDKGINNSRSDMHPTLSRDGRLCAFSAQLGIADGARIALWDRQEKKFLPLSPIT